MMNDKSEIDWDDAFANGAYIENSMSYPLIWAARAAAFRQEADRTETDMLYRRASAREAGSVFPKRCTARPRRDCPWRVLVELR